MTKVRPNIGILDLETNILNAGDNAIGNMKANPHAKCNDMVWFGCKCLEDKEHSEEIVTKKTGITSSTNVNTVPKLLVGQNVKFDLLYLMRADSFRKDIMPTLRIWDTMQVEYLLHGQRDKMLSLDKLAIRYGGTLKDDKIKALWDAGIDTADIDDDLIETYLVADLDNTHLVFLGQVKEVMNRGIMPLIKTQMNALLATTEMEYNGMYFDKGSALVVSVNLCSRAEHIEKELLKIFDNRLPTVLTPKVTSAAQLSMILFGGRGTTKVPEPMLNDDGTTVMFKSGSRVGTPRTRLVERDYGTTGMTLPLMYTTETKKAGVYKVDDGVLKSIHDSHTSDTQQRILTSYVLEYRKLTKDIKTYYEGYSNLVFPHDSCIHGNINHCTTNTGRLSSTAPNLQNTAHK